MGQPQQSRRLFRFGVFEVDPDAGELRKQGRKVALQEQPFRVLVLLLNHPGKLVTRDELRQQLWPADTFVDFDKSLNTAISKLREALGDESSSPRFVETVPRRGYRFLADVEGLEKHTPHQEPEARRQPERRGAHTAHRFSVWPVLAFAAGVVVLAVAAYWIGFTVERRTTDAPQPASIAVLPFADLSPERNQEYFCDGFVEELISSLAKLEGLRVVARDSVVSLKGKVLDVRAAGEQLNVTTILIGSIRKAGDKLRITAQLISVPDGSYLWANTYERPLHDVFAIQEDVSAAIVAVLRVKLAASPRRPLVKRYTDPQAHLLYLKGRYFWWQVTKEDLYKAITCFEQATALEPGYAAGFAGLADSYFYLGVFYFLPPHESMPKAKQAALKAVSLDEALGEARLALANVRFHYDWDWADAEREYRRAIELSPGDARARWFYGSYLVEQGRLEESRREMKQAEASDPLSAVTLVKAGFPLYIGRQYQGAIEKIRQALELDPNLWWGHWCIGQVYMASSQFDEAVRAFERSMALTGRTPLILAELARAYTRRGNRTEARRLFQEAEWRLKHSDGYASPLEMAWVYADLGDKERAFELLEKAYRERHYGLAWLKVWPGLDPIRSDPRFADLLHRMRLD